MSFSLSIGHRAIPSEYSASTQSALSYTHSQAAVDCYLQNNVELQAAAQEGNLDVIERLLKEQVDINAQDSGRTALQAAASGGHLEIVERLLQEGANVNTAALGCVGRTALQGASERGHLKVIERLLQANANVNAAAAKFDGRTALQGAAEQGHLEVIERLLQANADVDAAATKYYGRTALQGAAEKGHLEVVERLLQAKANVNAAVARSDGRTALQGAAEKGHLKVVERLLQENANVNAAAAPIDGRTALQGAAEEGHLDVVERLLQEKANVNSAAVGDFARTALQAAVGNGHDKVVERLLQENADVNATAAVYGGRTALEAAAENDDVELVKRLLQAGADVNAKTFGRPALQRALGRGHSIIFQMLSEYVSDSDAIAAEKEADMAALYAVPGMTVPLDESADVPKVPEVIGDDDSESGHEIGSNDDEDSLFYDCGPPEYDSPLASLRDRISEPVRYFDSLRALVRSIYRHSMLHIYSKTSSILMATENDEFSKPCSKYPNTLEGLTADGREPLHDSEVMHICQDVAIGYKAGAIDLFIVLECRNVGAQAYTNLKRLQLHGFCLQTFSVLTIDPNRHNVVRLLPVALQQISEIVQELESVLRKLAEFVSSSATSAMEPDQAFWETLSIPHSTEYLRIFGQNLLSPSTVDHLSILAVLRLVVSTIDLAVASYAGAHLDRLDEDFLGEELAVIDVLGPYASSLREAQIPSIALRRCHLQCLDSFHNFQPVWVFSLSDWEPDGHLFLSTKIEVFADIWGPLWKVMDKEANDLCFRYAVGNGYIYKWASTVTTPPLIENEILCHWVSNTTMECDSDPLSEPEEPRLPLRINGHFNGNEILLVGAVAAGCQRLTIREDCPSDLGRMRSALRDDEKVLMLGAIKEHSYEDSETYQLQAGYSGINASASKQYKRRGQSLKQAFVELWATTPELRDPRLLQDYYGLEISLCTHNAQRVQLGRILGLSSMRRYLKSFKWQTRYAEQVYFDALEHFREDNDSLQQLWEKYHQYRDNFEHAVLSCLKALEKTGVSHNEWLGAFLSSEVTPRPELVTFKPKGHSWIGLLKDSETSCCMAVIGDACLEFKHPLGVSCGHLGRSVLRTALMINGRNKPRGIHRTNAYEHETSDGWKSRWRVRALDSGSQLWLGRHGSLRVLSHLPEATLLMMWRASRITTAWKNVLDVERPHREYTEDIEKSARGTRPIPLFVISSL